MSEIHTQFTRQQLSKTNQLVSCIIIRVQAPEDMDHYRLSEIHLMRDSSGGLGVVSKTRTCVLGLLRCGCLLGSIILITLPKTVEPQNGGLEGR